VRELYSLRQAGDSFYLRFLNKYGDHLYCEFHCSGAPYLNLKGLDAFAAGDEVEYVGEYDGRFLKRINQGTGHH
jgi:hypothetical protein